MKTISYVLAAVILVLMSACGNKTQAAQETADSTAAEGAESVIATDTLLNSDSLKHTAEYLIQRIDTIYKYKSNRRFCTKRYLALDREASTLSEEMGLVYIDSDHWIAGQDIDPDWRYWVKRILSLNDSTASAEILVHNFSDQKVILDLRYERGDWYVDDFHTFYEEDGETYELIETEEIRRFISDANYNKYQTKIETVFGRNFQIDKYIDAINEQVAKFPLDSQAYVPFNEYAIVDIDQNGDPEVCVRNEKQHITAIFTTAGTTEMLASMDKSGDVIFYDKASEKFQKNLEDYVAFPALKWNAFEPRKAAK